MRNAKICLLILPLFLLAAACGGTKNAAAPTPPAPTAPQLTAPTLDAPSDDQQLETLRPELTVRNGTSNQTSGSHSYEFQIADNSAFSPVAVTGAAIAENAGGKTSFTPTQDLQPTTRMYWRARMTQGTTNSDWSPTGKFRTKLVGFNRPGELYDPLVHSESVGTPFGAFTFVPGKGIRLNDVHAYLRYLLPQTVTSGEFSMEVEGLHPNGPGGKPKIFQMMDTIGSPTTSRYLINAQYRGSLPPGGNPNNSIAFKAVLGDFDDVVEPELAKRNQSILMPDPSRTYFWQGTWTATSFRLIVRDGGIGGTTVYDYTMTAPGGRGYTPAPHYAFLGTNYEQYVADTGTFPGMTIRNVWLGDKPRPASLGSAIRALQ